MKRSTMIGLGAVGVVLVASTWSLMGGEDDQYVYNDPAACRADGKLTPELCEQRYQDARIAHARDARRFFTQGGCEGEYGSGRCERITENGVERWIPALAGFMVARGLLGRAGAAQPLLPPTRAACPPGNTIPECQPARTGGGSSGSSSGGRWYSTPSGGGVSTSRGSGSTQVGVTSRGGFGTTGRGGGGFSSGS